MQYLEAIKKHKKANTVDINSCHSTLKKSEANVKLVKTALKKVTEADFTSENAKNNFDEFYKEFKKLHNQLITSVSNLEQKYL